MFHLLEKIINLYKVCKEIKFHADDYGYSDNISKDILNCYNDGIINSVSIMIDTSDELIAKLKESDIKNISLHLNLTSLASTNNSSDEKFLKSLTFTKLFFLKKNQRNICIKEIDYQINKFTSHFPEIDLMIDGHHHIQIIPWIFKYLNKNYGQKIKYLRIPNEKLVLLNVRYLFSFTFYRNLLASMILKTITVSIEKNSKSEFAGLLYSGIYNSKSLNKHINLLNNFNNQVEITFHPGTGIESERNLFKKNHFKYVSSIKRKKEYLLLTNQEK